MKPPAHAASAPRPAGAGPPRGHGWIDLLLVVMTIIWGTNFAVVKSAFRELPPQAFNAVRMIIASAAFLAAIAAARIVARRGGARSAAHGDRPDILSIFHTPAPVTPRDWLALVGLGIVGHAVYQYFFIAGLARTSVANSSLLLATTPVVIALAGALLGHERVAPGHWAGAAVSLGGIYLVVGGGVTLGGGSLSGDLMMFVAVCCWAAYTLGARPLMTRHSPVAVSGISMAIGSALYVPLFWSQVRGVRWDAVSGRSMALLVYSALFALCVAYTIWYVGVRHMGSARTSAYSNFIPVVAMTSAVLFLGEPLNLLKIGGAAAVLAGVALTRAAAPVNAAPAEE